MRWLALLLLLAACTHQAPQEKYGLPSLCILDFEKQMCWVSVEKNIGFTFEQMKAAQKECLSSDKPCWMSLDTDDLKKILRQLNACSYREKE